MLNATRREHFSYFSRFADKLFLLYFLLRLPKKCSHKAKLVTGVKALDSAPGDARQRASRIARFSVYEGQEWGLKPIDRRPRGVHLNT
jgi:hypothetical protein